MQNELLKDVNAEKLLTNIPEELKQEVQFLTLPKNFVLCQKGSLIEHVYFFISGTVTIMRYLQSGRIYASSEMRTPYFIGDLEVLANHPPYAAATLITSSESKVFRVDSASFKKWFFKDEFLARKVAIINSTKLWNHSQSKGEFLMLDSYTRLLFQLKAEYELHFKGQEIVQFQKTKRQLGIEVNLNVRSVARKLAQAIEDNLITRDYKTISISKEQYKRIQMHLNDIL